MTRKYLKHKEDGEIFNWNEQLAKHPKLEEVTEEEAFPERFAPAETKKRLNKKAKVDIETAEPEKPDMTPPELGAQAARGLDRTLRANPSRGDQGLRPSEIPGLVDAF